MDRTLYFISIIASFIATVYLFLKAYKLFIGKGRIAKAITDYYSEQGYIITEISRLNVSDRIRYGVPVSFMWLYSYYFGFWRGKMDYVRKVDVQDSSEIEYIKYIEIQVKDKKIIMLKEIDSYRF